MKRITHPYGKVYIVGAGPGDPDLITVKAATVLRKADVILTDRLVSKEIIAHYAAPYAEVIYVGKQCRKGHSTPQKTINQLMVEKALDGAVVVRLKGGDISVFSNVLDELMTLYKHSITYEIIPGITAASGAAAYSGIPLTAREHANGVRFLTYYKSDVIADTTWQQLAATDDTLVFYMSAETLPAIVQQLKAQHITNDKLIAVVEQATTPLQCVTVVDFEHADEFLKHKKFSSPSLVIIGKVVRLYEQFKWRKNVYTDQLYFEEVSYSNAYRKNVKAKHDVTSA